MQVIILGWKHEAREGSSKATVGVSLKCLRGNVGRSLVAPDHPRHDVGWCAQLQTIPGGLRRHRHEYSGGSPAKAGRLRNYHYGKRPVGRTQADLLADGE